MNDQNKLKQKRHYITEDRIKKIYYSTNKLD